MQYALNHQSTEELGSHVLQKMNADHLDVPSLHVPQLDDIVTKILGDDLQTNIISSESAKQYSSSSDIFSFDGYCYFLYIY